MAGMRRLGQDADAHSRETSFAGLPKSCKLLVIANAQNTAAGTVGIVFDTIANNYGGYALTKTGANYLGITLSEPGIYKVEAQAGVGLVGLVWIGASISINGAKVFADGSVHSTFHAGNAAVGTSIQVAGTVEAKAGDVIGLLVDCYGATPLNTGGTVWISIKKEGGQY